MTQANTAALGLYQQAGFEEWCTYHYRAAAAPPNADPPTDGLLYRPLVKRVCMEWIEVAQ